jgi:hypothetical protein
MEQKRAEEQEEEGEQQQPAALCTDAGVVETLRD